MVYLVHYTNAKKQVSHHVVFIQGTLSEPKEVYVFPSTPALVERLNRLRIPCKKVVIAGSETAIDCPVCSGVSQTKS